MVKSLGVICEHISQPMMAGAARGGNSILFPPSDIFPLQIPATYSKCHLQNVSHAGGSFTGVLLQCGAFALVRLSRTIFSHPLCRVKC